MPLGVFGPPVLLPIARYRKCRPSGRKKGNACRVSPRSPSSVVAADDPPPDADTRRIGLPDPKAAKRMTSFRLHVAPPPIAPLLSASVRAGPPLASILS